MTFLEAAIEVLKREGKPLDTRRLAELAVKHNLLSVVGRDPIGTMQERIDDALEKQDPRMPLFELKRGTYGLRVYPPRPYPSAQPSGGARAETPVAAPPTNGEPKAEGAGEPAAEAQANGDGEKKRRRRGRRGGRGRRKREEMTAAEVESGVAEPEPDEDEAGEEELDAVTSEAGDAVVAAGGAAAVRATREAMRAEAGEHAEADEVGASEAERGEAAAEPDDASEGEEAVAATGEAGAAAGEKRSRRRSRRGGRGRRQDDRASAAAEPGADLPARVDADEEAEQAMTAVDTVRQTQAAAHADAGMEAARDVDADEAPSAMTGGDEPPTGDELLLDEGEEGDEDEFLDDFDLPAGPLLAPSDGAAEVARSDEERAVRAEILGRRSDERRGRRDRQRHGRRDERAKQGHEQKQPREAQQQRHHKEGQPQHHKEGQPQHQKEAQAPHHREQHPHKQPQPSVAPPQRVEAKEPGGLIGVALDVLRTGEGRPMHVRQLADVALKRKLVDGSHGDVVRQLRAALVREQRDREADGLRARVRGLGGGHFALADRKLDQELVPLERDLAQAALQLREATRAAVKRRIQRLSPPAFEALGRALLDKLGVTGVELVRRGEGVAYYGGSRAIGVASVKMLVAMRPGEAELGRRAVGELRAGLAAKGFDEGLLLGAGRANAEALTELKNGSGVVVHDGESLAALCIRHGLGVRRVQMPIDYLDVELFSELTEA